MDNSIAENYAPTAVNAVRAAVLIYQKQYKAAIDVLYVLAEKAEAAEAVGFMAQILQKNPAFQSDILNILALNLRHLRACPYAADRAYRQYIRLLYRGAAHNFARAGFTEAAKDVEHYLAENGFADEQEGDVYSAEHKVASLQTAVLEQENGYFDERMMASVQNAAIESDDWAADDEPLAAARDNQGLDERLLVEGKNSVLAPDEAVSMVLDGTQQAKGLAVATDDSTIEDEAVQNMENGDGESEAAIFDVEAENTATGDVEVGAEVVSESGMTVMPESGTTVLPTAAATEADMIIPETGSVALESVNDLAAVGVDGLPAPAEASTAETTDFESDKNNKLFLNNILNIDSHEVDEHFERIKMITTDAVKNAEAQIVKIKGKFGDRKYATQSLAKVKDIVQMASTRSAEKAAALAPAMQKIKGLAGKFNFKKNRDKA